MIPTSLAILFAKKSNHPKHRHAAILIGPDEIFVPANNVGNDHAEVRVIRIAKVYMHDLSKMTLISIAINKAGKLKLAKPCVGCLFQIKQAGIKSVYYSTRDQNIVKLKWED